MDRLDVYLMGLRKKYPGYVLLIRDGRWHHVYDQDADVMHRILNWDVFDYKGHKKTGGPVLSNITNALVKHGFAYKIIDDGTVVGTYDPPDPNAAFNAANDLPVGVVKYGSLVKANRDGNTEFYEIVKPEEVDSDDDKGPKKISYESPVGKAMLGHRRGDTVSADTPGGKSYIEIVDVWESV